MTADMSRYAPREDSRDARALGGVSGRTARVGAVALRRARADDIDAVVAIERASFGDAWSRASLADLVAHPHALFIVAEVEGRVAGYIVAWYVVDEAEIANVAVASEHRRRGIGERLLAHVLEEGRRRATAHVYLEVRESNAGARALYAAHGFDEIGRRARYYARPTEDAIVMRRTLGAEG
jgi:ribosomal-protein-alanine acetyltransferase